MAKIQREKCATLNIYKLRKSGYLKDRESGTLLWLNGLHAIYIKTFIYTHLNRPQGDYISYKTTITRDNEKIIDDDHSNIIALLTTKCNYGGKRYWFKCTACERMVAKLYMPYGGKVFACRHCYDLTYEKRIKGNNYTIPDVEEAWRNLKRPYYNGKPTRAHKRVIQMEKMLNRGIMGIVNKFSN